MQYERSLRPPLHLTLWSLFFFGVVFGLDHVGVFSIDNMFVKEHPGVLVFCSLMVLYVAIWTGYFMSVQHSIFRFQTLRLLLWTETLQMKQDSDPQTDVMREKGRSVLTTQAIFIAISVFVISALIDTDVETTESSSSAWYVVSANIALLLTTISVVLLVVAADSSETTFNKFKERDHEVVSYFYTVSAKRKYYGFVLAGLAILVFVSRLSPYIGSLGLALFMVVGYHLWFPDVSKDQKYRNEWLFMVVLIVVFIGASVFLYGGGLDRFFLFG